MTLMWIPMMKVCAWIHAEYKADDANDDTNDDRACLDSC